MRRIRLTSLDGSRISVPVDTAVLVEHTDAMKAVAAILTSIGPLPIKETFEKAEAALNQACSEERRIAETLSRMGR